MEITKRYTLENWRTNEVALHEIPEEVLSLPFEEVLRNVLVETNKIDLNIIEVAFFCIFDQMGWRVVRTPMGRSHPVKGAIAAAIESTTGIRDELYGIGVPDFFLWNSDGRHRFVEVKAGEEGLNSNQMEWAKEYNCEFYVAQLAPIDEGLSKEEIKDLNRVRRP